MASDVGRRRVRSTAQTVSAAAKIIQTAAVTIIGHPAADTASPVSNTTPAASGAVRASVFATRRWRRRLSPDATRSTITVADENDSVTKTPERLNDIRSGFQGSKVPRFQGSRTPEPRNPGTLEPLRI